MLWETLSCCGNKLYRNLDNWGGWQGQKCSRAVEKRGKKKRTNNKNEQNKNKNKTPRDCQGKSPVLLIFLYPRQSELNGDIVCTPMAPYSPSLGFSYPKNGLGVSLFLCLFSQYAVSSSHQSRLIFN